MSIMHQESETNRNNNIVYFEGYKNKLKPLITNDISLSIQGNIPDK